MGDQQGAGVETHVTELILGAAPAGAGGFKDTVIITVLVSLSGHGDLHLWTEMDSLSTAHPWSCVQQTRPGASLAAATG